MKQSLDGLCREGSWSKHLISYYSLQARGIATLEAFLLVEYYDAAFCCLSCPPLLSLRSKAKVHAKNLGKIGSHGTQKALVHAFLVVSSNLDQYLTKKSLNEHCEKNQPNSNI